MRIWWAPVLINNSPPHTIILLKSNHKNLFCQSLIVQTENTEELKPQWTLWPCPDTGGREGSVKAKASLGQTAGLIQ